MSLFMIYKAYMPVYKWSRFSAHTDGTDGPIEDHARGPHRFKKQKEFPNCVQYYFGFQLLLLRGNIQLTAFGIYIYICQLYNSCKPRYYFTKRLEQSLADNECQDSWLRMATILKVKGPSWYKVPSKQRTYFLIERLRSPRERSYENRDWQNTETESLNWQTIQDQTSTFKFIAKGR